MTSLTAVRDATPGRIAVPVAAASLLAAVAVAGVLSVLVGSEAISPTALLHSGDVDHVVAVARAERTLLGFAVGAALGLVGALMQGLTRNPLADPGILGINAGAALAMVLAISVFSVTDLQAYVWWAFVGAAAAMLLVHGAAAFGRDGATPVKVAVAGAAVTAAITSWTAAVLLTDRQTMESFRYWQVGTIGGRDLHVLAVGTPFLLVGAVLGLTSAGRLNALALGDDLARGLGRRVGLDRLVVGVAIVLLAGGATALAGPIAFAGLMVPHAVRSLVGPDHRWVLPCSAILGAALIVAADTLGRVVLPPTEVQVGIMTAVLGAPFFVLLVRRGKVSL